MKSFLTSSDCFVRILILILLRCVVVPGAGPVITSRNLPVLTTQLFWEQTPNTNLDFSNTKTLKRNKS